MKKIRIDNKGFSIVEAMVAIVILSIIFIPITNSFISSIKASQETKIMQAATTTAQQVMEDFKNDTIVNLANNYTVLGGTNVFESSWTELNLEKKISRADNNCCDFTVDVKVSKSSTETLTSGMGDINNVEFGKLTTLDSASNLILNVDHIPYWIAKDLLGVDFPAYDPTVLKEVREEQIRNALLSKNIRRKINIKLKDDPSMGTILTCEVDYYKNGGTQLKVDYIENTVLSSEVKNLYVYFPKFELGSNNIFFDNKSGIAKLNVYLIQNVNTGVIRVERNSNPGSLDNIFIMSNIDSEGAVSVKKTNDYVQDKEKRNRRYEVIVEVYKNKGTGREKLYSRMVSTRGE